MMKSLPDGRNTLHEEFGIFRQDFQGHLPRQFVRLRSLFFNFRAVNPCCQRAGFGLLELRKVNLLRPDDVKHALDVYESVSEALPPPEDVLSCALLLQAQNVV